MTYRGSAEKWRLAARKKKRAEPEAAERAIAISRSVSGKLDHERLTALRARMNVLGIDEIEKRHSA